MVWSRVPQMRDYLNGTNRGDLKLSQHPQFAVKMPKTTFALLTITVGIVASVLWRPNILSPHGKGPAPTETMISPESRPRLAEPVPEIASATSSRAPLRTQSAEPALDRVALTRALQRELKRVGCYHGDINGVWTESTQQAIKTFIERINARLPVSEPHQVLLALLQASQVKTCDGGSIAAATVPVDKTRPITHMEPAGPLPAPPMALAGPKVGEGDDGSAVASVKAAQKTTTMRPAPGEARSRNPEGPARGEHWTVKIWRNITP